MSIEERSSDGRWLRVRTADGTSGWITRRYLEHSVTSSDAGRAQGSSGRALESAAELPWGSRENCEKLLASGARAGRARGAARLASWNLRWFPDGGPGRRPREQGGTDIAWLACGIAWLDLDLIVVQEIKTYPGAQARLTELFALLDRATHGKWRAELDRCPGDASQHVGFFFNGARVAADKFYTVAALNPHGEPCKDQLRPGFGGYFRFPGGLDLHLVALHLKSGGERRAIELRQKSWSAISEAWQTAQRTAPDLDLLLAGDLNTMGCRHCSPVVTADEELAMLGRTLGQLSPALRRVEASIGCSQYFSGSGSLLDHFIVSSKLRELPEGRRAVVNGYCAEAACSSLSTMAMPPSYTALSDHCPLVLEIDDRDLD